MSLSVMAEEVVISGRGKVVAISDVDVEPDLLKSLLATYSKYAVGGVNLTGNDVYLYRDITKKLK